MLIEHVYKQYDLRQRLLYAIDIVQRQYIINDILATQYYISMLMGNEMSLPTLPERICISAGHDSDDPTFVDPMRNLKYSGLATLPSEYVIRQPNGIVIDTILLCPGSNIGQLPVGTIIDYANTLFVIRGNSFYRCLEEFMPNV